MPIGDQYLNSIVGFEGFTPKATWDYKQWTNGYGTRARFPGEVISEAEAKRRYQDEISSAERQVDGLGVPLDPGKKAALTSLTYNAGPKWMESGLGQAVKAGDWNTAKQRFLQYTKADGQTLPGLVKRRMAEASWLGGEPPQAPTSAAQNGAPMPTNTGVPVPASYSPDEMAMQRKLGMMLMQEGTSTAPVQSWTQALARVLQGAQGGYMMREADKQDRMMRGEGDALIGQYLGSLTGGSPSVGVPSQQPQAAAPDASKALGQALLGRPAPMTQDQQNVGRFAQPNLAVSMPRPQQAPPMAAQPPAQVADASGRTIDEGTLRQMLANPTSRPYAEAYIKKRMTEAADPTTQADLDYKRAQTAKINQELSSPKATATEGEKMLDKQFAKTYEEDIAGGKLADAVNQLQTLEKISKNLENPNGKNYSGPMLGMVPESVRAYTNPDSVAVQNDLANIIQRSLRPILGAQFTEKEGENLIKRAYNPQLDEATNAKRIKRLVDVSRKMAQQKMAAAQYFEQHGSLKGFKGSANFSITDVENEIDGDTGEDWQDIGNGVRIREKR